jgi:hypothetical protein
MDFILKHYFFTCSTFPINPDVFFRPHGRGVQPVQAYFLPDKNLKAKVQNSPQGVAVQSLFHIRLVGIDVAYGNIRLL